jgi:uncharacterized protein (DUF2132 family)
MVTGQCEALVTCDRALHFLRQTTWATPRRENWRISERERAVRAEIEIFIQIEENQ